MKQCKITIKKTMDCFDFTTKCSFLDSEARLADVEYGFDFTTKCSFLDSTGRTSIATAVLTLQQSVLS